MSTEIVTLSSNIRQTLICILKESAIDVLSEDIEDVVLNGYPGLNNMTNYDLVCLYEYIHGVSILDSSSNYVPQEIDSPAFKFASELMLDISTNRMLDAES